MTMLCYLFFFSSLHSCNHGFVSPDTLQSGTLSAIMADLGQCRVLQVDNRNIVMAALYFFCYEAAMAMLRRRFAAKQAYTFKGSKA